MLKKVKFEMTLRRFLVSTFGLVAVCMILGFAPAAIALPSTPVLMIDGSGDGIVDVMVFDTEIDFHFGYYDGGFQQILAASSTMATTTFMGGDIVDFAIQSATDSTIYRLSEGSATLDFTGLITADHSVNPTVASDYWGGLTIDWAVDNNNYVIALGAGDGFAPARSLNSAAPVPEPTAALTFAAGLAIASWRIRRHPIV